jgi:2-hydroxychromene-2-carboxylate isomerase
MQVWIEYSSTYSYLTVARIGRLSEERGVDLEWKPFLVAAVRDKEGLPFPFPAESPKTAYMWRDLERRARRYRLPYRRPEVYPVNSLLTARVGLVAAREGWCRQFTEGVFNLHWTEGRLIGTEDNLNTVLEALGKDPGAVVEQAQRAENKAALKAQNERAVELGIFGAPSFLVGGELFWGDDRLEDALDLACGR